MQLGTNMTVSELITELQKCDPELSIFINIYDENGRFEVGSELTKIKYEPEIEVTLIGDNSI
jgi:hypothetical protein